MLFYWNISNRNYKHSSSPIVGENISKLNWRQDGIGRGLFIFITDAKSKILHWWTFLKKSQKSDRQLCQVQGNVVWDYIEKEDVLKKEHKLLGSFVNFQLSLLTRLWITLKGTMIILSYWEWYGNSIKAMSHQPSTRSYACIICEWPKF